MKSRGAGRIAAFWGVTGFFLLLGYAVYRLTPIAIQALTSDLTWYHWLVFVVNSLFMAYSEGYRGFQQAYSPRLAARARYLLQHSTPLRTLLAPLFCMCYFDAPKRRVISTWILTIAIIILIILFRLLPQPWRGIMDGGVVIGLSWGVVATLIFCYQAFRNQHFHYSPEVPEEI